MNYKQVMIFVATIMAVLWIEVIFFSLITDIKTPVVVVVDTSSTDLVALSVAANDVILAQHKELECLKDIIYSHNCANKKDEHLIIEANANTQIALSKLGSASK